MLELYDLTQFQLWLEETNHLHRAAHLATNAPVHRFLPFSTPARETSRYYLYQPLEVGPCGSVELAQLATERVVHHTPLRQGTWIVKDSYFFLPDDHPYSNIEQYEPLIRDFYQQIFLTICSLSYREDFIYALTAHRSAHGDFVHLSDLTLQKEWQETDWINDQKAILGLLRLKDQSLYTSVFLNRRDKRQDDRSFISNDNISEIFAEN